jgi:hypothetical protein
VGRRADLRSYVQRDWALLAELKQAQWLAQRRLGPALAMRIADDLRRQVRAARPDWPSDEERAADLEAHIRVGEILRRASPPRQR